MARSVRTRLIDVTRPLGPKTFVFPGDPPIHMVTVLDPGKGDPARVTRLSLGSHAGTHVDAPCHLPGLVGAVDALSLDALIGEAYVVMVRGGLFGRREALALPKRIPPRLLLAGAPILSQNGARTLVQRGIRLLGTDATSIDPHDDDAMPAHRVLLSAGVVVVECLELSQAPAGHCDLIALPLRIPGADGAPARVVLRVRADAVPGLPPASRASTPRSRRVSTRRQRRGGTPPTR